MSEYNLNYPFEVRLLTKEEGSGWVVTFPDLPGCMSDGETPEEAVENAIDALECWLEANKEWGRDIPEPNSEYSGKFIQRVPRSLHARLSKRAEQEGVSMNALVTSFIAEYLGKTDTQP